MQEKRGTVLATKAAAVNPDCAAVALDAHPILPPVDIQPVECDIAIGIFDDHGISTSAVVMGA